MTLPIVDMKWEELSTEEQEAASVLGFTAELWDGNPVLQPIDTSVPPSGDSISRLSENQSSIWIVYLLASICFIVVGCLDVLRELRVFHYIMVLGGIFGLLSAILVEISHPISTGFRCASVHLFLLESILLLTSHALSSTFGPSTIQRDPVKSLKNDHLIDGLFQQRVQSSSSSSKESRIQVMTLQAADGLFVLSTFMSVVLSYFGFNQELAQTNLNMTRSGIAAEVFWFISALLQMGLAIKNGLDGKGEDMYRKRGGDDDNVSMAESCVIMPNDDGDLETVYNDQNEPDDTIGTA